MKNNLFFHFKPKKKINAITKRHYAAAMLLVPILCCSCTAHLHTVTYTSCAAIENDLSITNSSTFPVFKKRINSSLSDYELWCIALSGFYNCINHSYADRLDLHARQKNSFKKSANGLRNWWNITNRDELLTQISKCVNHGHSEEYNSYRLLKYRHPGPTSKTLVEVLPQADPYKIEFADTFGQFIGVKSLMAWDYGRAIWLCRAGYYLGWLTGEETWLLIEQIAEKIGTHYTSWKDYGTNYLLGRIFWGGPELYTESRDTYVALLSAQGEWTNTRWFSGVKSPYKGKWQLTFTGKYYGTAIIHVRNDGSFHNERVQLSDGKNVFYNRIRGDIDAAGNITHGTILNRNKRRIIGAFKGKVENAAGEGLFTVSGIDPENWTARKEEPDNIDKRILILFQADSIDIH